MDPDHTPNGACFCGAITYRLTAAPLFVHACHCRDCQKQTGGPFAINALIEREHVELLLGQPVRYEMATGSGSPHDIYRCPQCLTAVWSDYGRRRKMIFLRVATLDEPELCPPDVHIFTRTRLPFTDLPPGARCFEVFYDPLQEWPPASLERVRALGVRLPGMNS